jgi:hypothetical protein
VADIRTITKFLIRRGLEANLPLLDEGEPGLTLDSKRIFFGTGTENIEVAKKDDLEETNALLAEKASLNDISTKAEKSYVDTQIQSVVSGSPKGTYATLTDLQTAFPSGNTNIYLVTADGKWYYWNGSAWTAGGIYQSTGIGDKAVTLSKLSEEVPIGAFPFDIKATFKHNSSTAVYAKNIYESIKDIRLYNADPNAVYVLGRAKKSSTDLSIIVYRVNGDGTTTMVCSYYLANPSLAGIQELTLSTNNTSGITGKVVVDVSTLASNGDFDVSTSKLHRMAYAADLMGKDIKSQITTLKEYKYPFDESATFFDDSNVDRSNYVLKGIIDLKVDGAAAGEKYYLRNFNLANNTVQIGIGRYSDDVLVATYYSTSNPRSGIQTLTIPQYQSSGVSAHMVVDWSKFSGFTSNLLFTNKKDNVLLDKSATMEIILGYKKWRGKKWYNIGDSITNADQYQPYVKKICGFREYVKDAVSGQQIITMGDNITSTSFSDTDIVTVFCGANDYAGNRELGTMADDKTVVSTYGALKKLIDKILTTKPEVGLAFITCTQIGLNQYTFGWKQPNNLGYTQEQYNDAIKEVCNYYSIPVLDLYNNGGINNFNFSKFTVDELHPNDAGYRLVGTKIASFLNEY